jgi:integrase
MGVQKLKPGVYFDTKLPSFGIRVGKHRRTWIIMKGQHPRRSITLGQYPAVSLRDARKKATAAFVAPDIKRATITFPEAKEEFLRQDRWRPQTKRVLTSNLKHFTWKGQLAKITQEQVLEALDQIEGKSARWHAKKDITTFFNWCVPRYLAANPATGIRMEKQPSRDRVLTDDELVKVWKAAEQMGQFGRIIRLLIATGQRRTEIGSLHASYISDDRIVWPADAVKNGVEHHLPLGTLAKSLLPTATNGYLFPATREPEKPFSAWSKSHSYLLKLSGTSGWTLHDLRRAFATNLAALKVRQEVTEKILNHISGSVSGVAAIYNRHSYFSEMREALQLWEERLQSLLARQ